MTPQRQIILDALCAIGHHTTANEIFERVHATTPAINRATVFDDVAFGPLHIGLPEPEIRKRAA